MKSIPQDIPENLVYEIYNGKPIRYKGYKQVLKGTEQMGSSYIQALIISNLFFILKSKLSPNFVALTSEVGLNLSTKSKRAADIAIFEKMALSKVKEPNKYLAIPPKYVIEVDIKASNDDIEDASSYYHKKTDELLSFGVDLVVWIFTESQKVMIAEKNSSDWKIFSWDRTFFDIENIEINVKELAQ